MHQTIQQAAASLWVDGHYLDAVSRAAEALIGQVKSRLERNDLPPTQLWDHAFSNKPPKPGEPRLRWPGDPNDQTVTSINEGLRKFAPGIQLLIRNTATHTTDQMSQQEALERLASLSLLARYVDGCELLTEEPPAV